VSPPVEAYVFDLYGTLLDFGSLSEHFEGLVADPVAFVDAWRRKQLQYALTASAMERYVDFDTLTAFAFDYTCAAHDLRPDAAARAAALEAWSALPPFADVAEALTLLRARGRRCAVLSNGTARAVAAALGGAGLADFFETVLSVEAVRTYKPRPAVYELAVAYFGVAPERVAFVSSNGWDATGAAEFGFRVTWCNRAGQPAETFGKAPERIVRSLTELLHE
jgi:2-haloacid dehalogenase